MPMPSSLPLRVLFLAVSTFGLCASLALAPRGVRAEPMDPLRVQSILTQAFNDLAADERRLDELARSGFGPRLAPEKAALVKNGLRQLLADPALPTYMTAAVAPRAEDKLSAQDVQALGLEALGTLQVQGLGRLTPQRQAYFVRYMVSFMRSMEPGRCKAMVQGQLSDRESVAAERAYRATRPLKEFGEVQRLYVDAAKAELARYPDPPVLTAAQAEATEDAYSAILIKRLAASRQDALHLLEDPAPGEPAAVCAAFREAFLAMLDLPEPYRGWQLSRYIASIQ